MRRNNCIEFSRNFLNINLNLFTGFSLFQVNFMYLGHQPVIKDATLPISWSLSQFAPLREFQEEFQFLYLIFYT